MEFELNWATKDGEAYFPSKVTTSLTLSTGSYGIEYDSMEGVFFVKKQEKTDHLMFLSDSISSILLREMDKFWASKKRFESVGFIWKQGFLLYGGPGSGKSSSINLIKGEVAKRNGIIFYGHYDVDYTIEALQAFRKREVDRPILLIQEDLETILNSSEYNKSKMLGLLDGENQIENIIVIATTNYIDKIPDTVKKRPGRFGVVQYVGPPSAAARREYLLAKFAKVANDMDIERIVTDSEGFYFSHLRELVAGLICYRNEYNVVLEKVRELLTTHEEEYKQHNDAPCKVPQLATIAGSASSR
jgi:hypothetical protein